MHENRRRRRANHFHRKRCWILSNARHEYKEMIARGVPTLPQAGWPVALRGRNPRCDSVRREDIAHQI
jgi:hypothetical protein